MFPSVMKTASGEVQFLIQVNVPTPRGARFHLAIMELGFPATVAHSASFTVLYALPSRPPPLSPPLPLPFHPLSSFPFPSPPPPLLPFILPHNPQSTSLLPPPPLPCRPLTPTPAQPAVARR